MIVLSRHTSRRHCTINAQLLFRNFVSIELNFCDRSDLKKLNFFLLTFTHMYIYISSRRDRCEWKKFIFYWNTFSAHTFPGANAVEKFERCFLSRFVFDRTLTILGENRLKYSGT